MRQHEAGLPPPPGKADDQGQKHVDGKEDIDRSEPPRPIDAEAGRRRAAAAFEHRRPDKHGNANRDQGHGQLHRTEGL